MSVVETAKQLPISQPFAAETGRAGRAEPPPRVTGTISSDSRFCRLVKMGLGSLAGSARAWAGHEKGRSVTERPFLKWILNSKA